MVFKSNSCRTKFTKHEDKVLQESVKELGDNNWAEISERLPGRNPRQCKDRWEKYLSPNVNISPFSAEEDIQLLRLRETMGPKWILISKQFNNRSDNSLKSRYKLLMRQKMMNKTSTENSPSEEYNAEDLLFEDVDKYINIDSLFDFKGGISDI